MDSKLDPVIRSKLLEFRSRFRVLVFVRGLCCVLLALLGGLLLHSVIDYLVVMEDRTRYVLSGGMYLATVIVLLLVFIRPLLQNLEERELAAMMERQHPLLKSKLLSAVELAEDEEEGGSKIFQRQAQAIVTEDLRGLEMERILPAKLVQTWLISAAVVILVAGLMAAFQFGRTQLLRALMPMANIERFSFNKVLVLAPEGGNGAVPEYDEIQIRIRVQGPKIKKPPYLLAEGLGESAQKAFFVPDNNPDAKDEYAATITVGSQNINYRVYAGDAVSRRYTLISRQRPRVVKYEKTYTYPEYVGRPPHTVAEDQGDISALIGTKVKLTLHLNQQIETAVMDWVGEKPAEPPKFEKGEGPKKWVLEMPLQESGEYKVNLMTAEKLSNKSPVQYSIEAKTDDLPAVELIQSEDKKDEEKETARIPIVFKVTDDIGLDRWEQLFKTDKSKAGWESIHTKRFDEPLITNSEEKLDWDLLKLNVKVGDTVLTKIVVFDRNDNNATSDEISVKVNSDVFDEDRLAAWEKHMLWVKRLDAAITKSLGFCDVLPNQIDDLLLKGKAEARRNKVTEALKKLGEAKASWEQTMKSLPASKENKTAGFSRPGRETAGFSLIGRLGVRLELDWFPRVEMHLQPFKGLRADTKGEIHFKYLPDLLKEVRLVNKSLKNTSGIWLAADEAAVAIDYLDYIQREAKKMHRKAETNKDTDGIVWVRLAIDQANVGKDLAAVQDVLKELVGRMEDGGDKERIRTLLGELKEAHEKLVAKHAEGIEPDSTLLITGDRWSKAITRACEELRPLARGLAERAQKAHEDLENSVSSTADGVRRLINAWEAKEEAEKNLAKARNDAENVLTARQRRDVTKQLLDFEWTVAREILRRSAKMETFTGQRSSSKFANNVHTAAAAIEAVREGFDTGRATKKVKGQIEGIADALTILETSYELDLLGEAAKSLADLERRGAEQKSTVGNSLHPRDWDWLARKLRTSPKKLREAGLAGEEQMSDLVKGAAARDVDKEMKNRQKQAGFFEDPNESKTSN